MDRCNWILLTLFEVVERNKLNLGISEIGLVQD